MAQQQFQNFVYETVSAVPVTRVFLSKVDRYQDDPKNKGYYKAAFRFTPDHPDLISIKNGVAGIARAQWGADVDLMSLSVPWSTGEALIASKEAAGKTISATDYRRGHVFLFSQTPETARRPVVTAAVNGVLKDLDPDEIAAYENRAFYPGAECYGVFNFSCHVMNGQKGVHCWLNMIISTGVGERIDVGQPSGAARFQEKFTSHVGHVNRTFDPTQGMPATF